MYDHVTPGHTHVKADMRGNVQAHSGKDMNEALQIEFTTKYENTASLYSPHASLHTSAQHVFHQRTEFIKWKKDNIFPIAALL